LLFSDYFVYVCVYSNRLTLLRDLMMYMIVCLLQGILHGQSLKVP